MTTKHANSNTNAHCHYTIAWHSVSAAKRCCSVDRLVVHQCCRAPHFPWASLVHLLPGGPTTSLGTIPVAWNNWFLHLKTDPNIPPSKAHTSKIQNTSLCISTWLKISLLHLIHINHTHSHVFPQFKTMLMGIIKQALNHAYSNS